MKKYQIAVLDDYQGVALESADWSVLRDRADIAVFQNHVADPDAVIQRLLPFDVVCVMRERTPLPRIVVERLPNLKLIASTGPAPVAPVPNAGQHTDNAAYRLRIARSLYDVLRGYRLEHPDVARLPLSTYSTKTYIN